MGLRITTLSENTTVRAAFLAEWGLSILVEVEGLRVLLDTGRGIALPYNADALGINLSQIDKMVLSHGHLDHTGGLREVLSKMKKEVEVIAHPDIWAAKYVRLPRERYSYRGIPFQREELESLGASFTLTKEPVWISENIVTTGEIPMVTEYEKIDPDLYVREGGEFHPDPLWDDRALIIKTELGLVVVLGCTHRGIINTLRYAQELTGVERIHTAVGGTHLFRASEERLALTIAELKEIGIQRLGVSHCTGMPAAMRLAQEFGDAFFFNNAGTRVTIP
jgi:7,8-dihydropterin-6-yl-methyl-4-(beta-D-ribofuranosyl)aminobenzene 5'-phosphate synthase